MPERDWPDIDPLGVLAMLVAVAAAWALLRNPSGIVGSGSGAILLLVLLGTVALVSVVEWRRGAIPNALTLPGAAVALVIRFVGNLGVLKGVAGCLLLFLVPAAINGMYRRRRGVDGFSPGVFKLLAMVGAFVGPVLGLAVLAVAWGIELVNILFLLVSGYRRPRVEFGPPICAAVAALVLSAWLGWVGAIL